MGARSVRGQQVCRETLLRKSVEVKRAISTYPYQVDNSVGNDQMVDEVFAEGSYRGRSRGSSLGMHLDGFGVGVVDVGIALAVVGVGV